MKTASIFSRWTSRTFLVLLLVSACGLAGCLSRPSLIKQTFSFCAPELSTTNATVGDRVLGIRNLQIARPFDGRSLVYRTGEFSYERDPYAEFVDSPAEGLIAPVRGWLRGNGDFSAVVEADSAFKPDTQVEISVSQLFGDFRNSKHPAAILTMRFVFFDAPNGVPGKVILQKEYSRNIPLSAPTAAALMEGWNQALAEIIAEVSSGFRHSGIGVLPKGVEFKINSQLNKDQPASNSTKQFFNNVFCHHEQWRNNAYQPRALRPLAIAQSS